MPTPHLEVIPRIIDASLAANYQKAEPLATNPEPIVQQPKESTPVVATPAPVVAAQVVAPTFTQRFFATVKDYMIPILFIIVVIVCIYVLWKYFTKYRTPVAEPLTVSPQLPVNEPDDTIKPDLSKYINADSSEDEDGSEEEEEGEEDSDEDADDDESMLSIIEEGSDEQSEEEGDTDEESEEQSDDQSDEEDEDHESLPSLITEPDLDAISNLINQPIDRPHIDTFLLGEEPERFEYVSPTPEVSDNESTNENQEDDIFNIAPEETKPKPRKARKPKRVVL